jgi:hypothetical protein
MSLDATAYDAIAQLPSIERIFGWAHCKYFFGNRFP